MDRPNVDLAAVTAAINVDDLLTAFPVAARVFVRHRMACVGCEVARFESLAEACRIYGEDVEAVAEEIRQAIREALGAGARETGGSGHGV
ncbi:MAG TPA: DUF1858 domain-containing protein [Isosphaeraceae bacterium]|nr:DUF1858 domain-containing protein [Isosphaeraceae bacterium]